MENNKIDTMHLMVTNKCNHNCELCCNKFYDIDKIPCPTVEELKTVHTVCLTGGEPFLPTHMCIDDFAISLKKDYKNIKNIYVYASTLKFQYIDKCVLKTFDGINISPKDEKDWENIRKLLELAQHDAHLKNKISIIKSFNSNRLYVFKDQSEIFEKEYSDIVDKLNLNVLYRTWDEKFVTPNNEIFRRLPIFLI